MKRRIQTAGARGREFALLGFIASTALLVAASGASGGAQNSAAKPETAKQKYKNIKVLKDLPADQLGPLMHQINASLGVKCDFCHVIETTADGKHVGWERDDKKMKSVARDMMRLTQKLYKEKMLKGKASCFMCHKGRPEPDVKAPPEAR